MVRTTSRVVAADHHIDLKGEIDMWREGTIEIPVGDETKIAHFWVKFYEEGSEFGINGGRISKLEIRIDNKVVVHYDRGWDVKPDENNQAIMVAYYICLKDYN